MVPPGAAPAAKNEGLVGLPHPRRDGAHSGLWKTLSPRGPSGRYYSPAPEGCSETRRKQRERFDEDDWKGEDGRRNTEDRKTLWAFPMNKGYLHLTLRVNEDVQREYCCQELAVIENN